MNPLIKKEIRLLLPAWVVTLLLAIFPSWIMEHFMPGQRAADDFPPQYFIIFGFLLLCISSLGQEMAYKTFSLQMAQPVSRSRVWRTKLLMLAAALLSTFAAATISWNIFVAWHPGYQMHFLDDFRDLPLWTLVLLSGALWTTLLLRQVVGAFWITILAPMAIMLGVSFLGDFFRLADGINAILRAVLLVYSAAGLVFAHRLFFRAQDTQWTGGNVLFPWRRTTTEQTSSRVFSRFRNPYLALIFKEIQLQEVTLFIAMVVLVLHLAALPLRMVISNMSLKMAVDCIWTLWLLMPLLIGSASVAEERRLGLLDPQLCLPLSRSRQFSIKFFVGLALSLVFGALVPTLIEHTRDFETDWYSFWIFIVAPAVFFLSFYASTLARATLQAIGIAMAIPIVAGAGGYLFFTVAFSRDPYEIVGKIFLMVLLGGPALLLVLARLMFWNYKWLHETSKIWWRNLSALLILLAGAYILSNAIFYRPWEWLSPIESPHGPSRLDRQTSITSSFSYGSDILSARLPDGRLWQENINFNEYDFQSFNYWYSQPELNTQRLLGSPWAEFAQGHFYFLGIRPNGSLWGGLANRTRLDQIGSDTNWAKVASQNHDFLLLKKNGTLWLWGTNDVTYSRTAGPDYASKYKADMAMAPVLISQDTNWTDLLFFQFNHVLIQKTDGSYWSWRGRWIMDSNNPASNDNRLIFQLVRENSLNDQWTSYANNWQFAAEVTTNGELWFFSQPVQTKFDVHNYWEEPPIPFYRQKIRLGFDADWKAVHFSTSASLLLLKQDGTLWKWKVWEHPNFDNWSDAELTPFHPVQLGHNSDWVAFVGDDWQGLALAADGGIWAWNEPGDHFWLAPSRRPVYFGNIFQGTSKTR